ncbi:MFS general substrate transporter [Dothidotthia symphoricarpi CBS 119687]|uniref:MFS general substrate transporter n=1 Tax=Dothidotthia symphoricarpi CBS 119687 TaxID=1392245 RepID=A0A6A6ATW0_9PLEO|nr:MFS general substrate transporter [Dothidotthia symphoricarpi CBS 119687]KAF2134395.1 MFS general substrate transporter [Dothidotthia symphoricarpi CBS 119687]
MSRTSTSIELAEYPSTPLAFTEPPGVHVHAKDNDLPSHHESLQPTDVPDHTIPVEHIPTPGKGTTAIVLVTVVCVTMISTMLSGVVAIALPTMARELPLAPNVLLWPISIYALTCGCTLLLLGSVADVVGSRPMYLIGCFLQSGFTLACGLAQNGTQMIVFRAFAGVAISFCLPSAVSIITSTFPEGRSRNIAFASMGGGQPIGFSLGLVLGGVFTDTIGWRWGFHVSAAVNTIVFVVAFIGLPKSEKKKTQILSRLKSEIDWVGIAMGSASLALLSYCFALISEETAKIKEAQTIALLTIAVALIPSFVFWVGRQEKLGRPAIIPNSLWRNRIFSVICVGVFITWGVFNALESYLTLFFQDVQQISAIQTSLRFLPTPVAGAITNLIMGLVVHRVHANWAVIIGASLSAVGGLLMCVMKPEWTYWSAAFFACILNAIGADVLFTVSNLVITSVFPSRTQGIAGGVFNTIAQIGKSVGLATSAVIASSVTARSRYHDKESPMALMDGFRAAFWYLFALSCATGMLFLWGLRGIGKVGVKRE